MKISTKGRYALRFMVYLGMHTEQLISLKEVSNKEDISLKYLEQIAAPLQKAKLIQSTRGAQGGYSLNRAPKDYTIKEILEVLEGPLTCVACLEGEENECERKEICPTVGLYAKLNELVNDYLSKYTLQDLIEESHKED